MDWIVYSFGSGAAFFVGLGLLAVALAAFALSRRKVVHVLATLLAVVGVLFVAFSATPLPYWYYALAGGATLLWLVAERAERGWLSARRNWLRGAVGVLWAAGAGVELPYHILPTLAASGRPKLYIIGDSVAAGLNEGEKDTWPSLLARAHPVEVADLSRMGATTTTALKQTQGLPAEGGLVLLEIGGNDLLGRTTAAEFEAGLDRLLARVCAAGRPVLMFELPLPPFHNDFGRIQRRLASEYGVTLIPKRVFLAVLTGDGATLDSIHLARDGHERMAETVWAMIRPAYGD